MLGKRECRWVGEPPPSPEPVVGEATSGHLRRRVRVRALCRSYAMQHLVREGFDDTDCIEQNNGGILSSVFGDTLTKLGSQAVSGFADAVSGAGGSCAMARVVRGGATYAKGDKVVGGPGLVLKITDVKEGKITEFEVLHYGMGIYTGSSYENVWPGARTWYTRRGSDFVHESENNNQPSAEENTKKLAITVTEQDTYAPKCTVRSGGDGFQIGDELLFGGRPGENQKGFHANAHLMRRSFTIRVTDVESQSGAITEAAWVDAVTTNDLTGWTATRSSDDGRAVRVGDGPVSIQVRVPANFAQMTTTTEVMFGGSGFERDDLLHIDDVTFKVVETYPKRDKLSSKNVKIAWADTNGLGKDEAWAFQMRAPWLRFLRSRERQ